MSVPLSLEAAFDALPSDPRFQATSVWTAGAGGVWSFSFRVRLSVQETTEMPEWTEWHLVLSGALTDPELRIFPDAISGITATFPHQDYNGDPLEGRPWRRGKPCIERPAAVFRRSAWGGEPSNLTDRLIWSIGRLLEWIDAAATGTLLEEGDPLELPTYPTLEPTRVLGFSERTQDLHWLTGSVYSWGFANISPVPGTRDTAVITGLLDPQRRLLRRITWGAALSIAADRIDAVWVALPRLLVIEPWRTARTWAELTQLCEQVSINLPMIMADAGSRLRRFQRPKSAQPVHLLLGFPLAERIGDEAKRFHWLAVRNMHLCTRNDVRAGFSNRAEARRQWDIDLARSDRPIEWRSTANWAPDQLRKRGEAEDTVRSKSVLIIGAGTLGAAVAENLLRMGVTKMALLDDDRMLVGNLSRHSLTLEDVGHLKAERMARRLNLAAPDAQVMSLPFSFPPIDVDEVKTLAGWDVVVDCTASDSVLHAMAAFQWKTERVFVSIAMTWQAKGLFAYTASEASFPALDAISRFSAIAPLPEIGNIGEMEGIGCWHPVFPATADDVSLWGAIASKFIRRAILSPATTATLYLQREDGSVESLNA